MARRDGTTVPTTKRRGGTNVDSFVGCTENVTAGTTLGTQLASDLVGIGNATWLRWQQKWSQIELTLNTYTWTNSDAMVLAANANGIQVLYQIQSEPTFRLTRDGLGNSCTLQGALTTGVQVTSITVSALPVGAYIPPGSAIKLALNYAGGTQELVTVAAPTGGAKYYGAGATSININAFTPAHNHSIGEQIYEQSGPQFAKGSDFANFAQLVATRYNGLNGHGTIQAIQIGNEEHDSGATRIGPQVTTASWDGSSTWDNGGAIGAPVFSQARKAILQVYPGIPVLFCAVRRTGGTPGATGTIAHGANWTQGFVQSLTQGQIPDWFDLHFYHGGDQNYDGALVQDPTINTYTDATLTTISSPNIATWIQTLQNALSSISPAPLMLCGEMGWDLYDDGSGQTFTTSQTITSGTHLTQITVNTLGQAISNGTPLWIDNNSTPLVESGLYAFGTAASGATILQITTDPRGNGTGPYPVTQAAWTPAHTHSSGVNCYAQSTTDTVTPAVAASYHTKMYNALIAVGGKCFFFTDNTGSAVTATPPYPAQSNNIKSIGQSIGGVWTLLAPYASAQQAALQNPAGGAVIPATKRRDGASTTAMKRRDGANAVALRRRG